VLPFLLTGVAIGWVYRAIIGHGQNFYAALFAEYGIRNALVTIVGLMVASSLFSIGIRQFRHLQEKPSDFLRLPIFILFSSLFLTPIRIIGFFRMAHVAGWGTRAGAYGGTADDVHPVAPTSVAVQRVPERVLVGTGVHAVLPATSAPSSAGSALDLETLYELESPTVQTSRPARAFNAYALIPYVLGAALFAVQAVCFA
jgi:hypothetical protein